MRIGSVLITATALIFLGAGSACADQLVVNGDFEAGGLIPWEQWGDTSFIWLSTITRQADGCSLQAGPAEYGGISQDITTVPGLSYDISFWLQNETNPDNDLLTLSWGGTELLRSTSSYDDWTYFDFKAPATSTTTGLQFGFQNPDGFYYLDDVSVSTIASAAPEPAAFVLTGLGLAGLGLLRRKLV